MTEPIIEQLLRQAMEHRRSGRASQAEAIYRAILQRDSNCAEAYDQLGTLLLERGAFAEAAESLRSGFELDSTRTSALRNLCLALVRIEATITDPKRREMARQYIHRAADLPCATADDWFIRALALVALEEPEQANRSCRKALQIDPSFLPARLHLGITASFLGRNDKALEAYRRVVDAQPDSAFAHVSYGMGLLFAGQYLEGWQHYSWRWKAPPPSEQPRAYPQPIWRGQEVNGKRVLLYAEQGFGDTIQFVRYAPLIAQRGARVIVQCPPALVKLLARTSGIERVISENDALPPFDFHASMMDLPMVFGTTLQTIPAEVPYLKCAPAKVERWAARLAADEPQGRPARRIGLCWSGNPRRNQNRIRSIPLEMLSPLGALNPRLKFISLQKSFSARNSGVSQWLADYDNELTDFEETAALMMNLDLIITVDTAIAHLAGALALQTWTMLCLGPDWRYMAHQADMPWYPTMRLFRQTGWNDWIPVIEQVRQMLSAGVKS